VGERLSVWSSGDGHVEGGPDVPGLGVEADEEFAGQCDADHLARLSGVEEFLAEGDVVGLEAGDDAGDDIEQAADAGEIAELGRTYQRLARSLRQTLALEARLERERAEAEAKRKAEVREALARIVWNEYEREDAEAALDEADWHIRIDAHQDRFLTDPIPTLVARLCRDLEIPLPSPEPGEGSDASDPGEPPDRQSSA